MKKINQNIIFGLILVLGASFFSGCTSDPRSTGIEYAPQMYHSIPLEPFTQVKGNYAQFKDSMNSQLPPEGTVAVDGWEAFPYANTEEDKERATKELKNPLAITPESLEKGEVLFNRFCAVCHGKKGKGDGNVPKLSENYPPPPSYDSKTAAEITEGRIYYIITYGQNTMGSYASQLNPTERWSIVQYAQTLQKDYKVAKTGPEVNSSDEVEIDKTPENGEANNIN